ncbi:MAG: DUF748 domain-containing protein [Planctomycetia bacterium]|nr:DUF748 domain-containing protein [Planctomycetia bacterium]
MAKLRSWWARGLLGGIVGLGLLVALGPKLVAHTPLLDWVIQSAAADIDGTVSCGSASLGWFSPVVLENVAVTDRDGRPLLTIGRVAGNKTLLQLARDAADLGEFRCERLVLSIHSTEQQTNLETVLARLLAGNPDAPTRPRPALALHIVQGQVRLEDAPTQRHWQLDEVNLSCLVPREPASPVQLDCAARLAGQPIAASLKTTLGDSMQGQLQASAALPLALLGPVVRRIEPSARLDGTLAARVTADWDTAAESLRVDGSVSLRKLSLTSQHLGQDRLELAQVELPCQLHVKGRELYLDRVEVSCDAGRAALAGKVTLGNHWLDLLAAPGWRIQAEADLARLAALLPRTLGLDRDHAITAGQATVEAASTATPTGSAWSANVRTVGLRAVQQGQPLALPEPVSLTLAAHQDRKSGAVLDRLRCDTPFLHLEAAGPFERLAVAGRADLARLQTMMSITGLQLAGSAELSTEVRLAADAVRAEQVRITVKDFQGSCAPFQIKEPQVDLTTTLHVNLRSPQLVLTETRLACPTVAVAIPAFAFAPGGDLAVRGTIQGDLERLQRWIGPPTQPVRGTVAGRFALQPDSAATRWEFELTGKEVVFGSPRAPVWSEPTVKLNGRGSLHGGEDRLAVQDLQIQTTALRLAVRGDVRHLSANCDLALSGQLDYDLAKLTPQLRAALGLELALAGQGSRACTLAGSLASPSATTATDPLARFNGTAALGWDGIKALGCDIGRGEASLELREGWVRTRPIEATLNGGRLLLSPTVRLTPGPLELHVPRGRIIDRAKLTPALCAGALGVALPTLAGVAQVSGEVSADIDSARVTVGELSRADATGRLTLQGVKLGASPLIRELSVLLRSPALSCELRDGVVPVVLKDGRVQHRDLHLVFPELTVTTQGSVGLDGSLALVAEFPVPPKWLGADRLGSALSQQKIRVPMRGTLTHPRLDADELARASARIVRDAARDGVRREVQDSLRRFLPK